MTELNLGFFIIHYFRKLIALTSSNILVQDIPKANKVSRLLGSFFRAFKKQDTAF